MKSRLRWSDCLRDYPPLYVRLLAKHPGQGHGMSDAEIALGADLTIDRVREISLMETWDGVTVGEMIRFFAACRFDPTRARDRERATIYANVCTKMNRIPFSYLRRSPKWESEFQPLLSRLPRILRSIESASIRSGCQTSQEVTHAT